MKSLVELAKSVLRQIEYRQKDEEKAIARGIKAKSNGLSRVSPYRPTLRLDDFFFAGYDKGK